MKRPQQANLNQYLQRMEAGLEDKLFFLDDLHDVDVFIDYGCADGVLLQAVAEARPKAILLGFDDDEQLLDLARTRLEPYGKDRFIRFSSNYEEIAEKVFYFQEQGLKAAIILSSVLHEIHSFLGWRDIEKTYDEIAVSADYIVIRDMGLSSQEASEKVPMRIVSKIHNKSDPHRLRSFLSRYHQLVKVEHFVHYLLKYPFKENWAREMTEDYILMTETLWEDIEQRGYEIIEYKNYTHPYVKQRIEKEFDIDFPYNTHFKLIAKKTD